MRIHIGFLLLAVMMTITLAGCQNRQWPQQQWNKRGMAEYEAGRYQEAEQYFLRSNHLDPTNTDTLYNLAASYHGQDKLMRAIYYYKQVISLQPGHRKAQQGLTRALEENGDGETATSVTIWSTEYVDNTADGFLHLARSYHRNGDRETALLNYQKAISVEPESAHAHAEYARYCKKIGQEDKAKELLLTAYQLNPDEPGVAAELGQLSVALPMSDAW